MDYKEAGVDVELGDKFVDRIKPFIKRTYNENVHSGVGGFAALYDQGDSYLATGTDGVGTKIKLAIELGIHHTIGEDLVAMCVNDILCTGAMPLFFLDYLATSKLDLDIHEQVVKGIASGCEKSVCALVGGETAEMPGMYAAGDYDLAGFVVGQVKKDQVIDGQRVKLGMKIVGLPSSGFHSNGYSLVRKLIENSEESIKEKCLTPTKIYVKDVKDIMSKTTVYGMAHITGGGLNNIKRINDQFGYEITQLPPTLDFMQEVYDLSNLGPDELYKTFNMGLGFVFVIDADTDVNELHPELIEVGKITEDFTGVKCLGTSI